MMSWTPVEWAAVMIALGTLVNTVLIAVAAFLANLAKIRGEMAAVKIDANTEVTKAGAEAAVVNAKAAAATALDAKQATKDLSTNLMNGAFDERVIKIVKEHTEPLVVAFMEHNQQDERNMQEIRRALQELNGAR